MSVPLPESPTKVRKNQEDSLEGEEEILPYFGIKKEKPKAETIFWTAGKEKKTTEEFELIEKEAPEAIETGAKLETKKTEKLVNSCWAAFILCEVAFFAFCTICMVTH